MSKNAFLSGDRLGVGSGTAASGAPGAPGDNRAGTLNRATQTQSAAAMLRNQPRPPTAPHGQERMSQDRMTLNGVTTATGILASILLVGAFFGWGMVEEQNGAIVSFPGWITGAILFGVVILGVAYFKPHLAKFLGPAYALIEGVVVGAISKVYEVQFDGIVMQATLATIGIFGGMLVVYSTGLIKVTDKFRRGIMAATMAIMAMYLISLVTRLFGSSFEIPFLHDSGPIGIGISLVIIVIAAFNYLLDFDFIEKAIRAGAPRDREWVAALGLLVTTVWVYFEVLRLLAKLRD